MPLAMGHQVLNNRYRIVKLLGQGALARRTAPGMSPSTCPDHPLTDYPSLP